jgi:hypothetical protein
VTGIRGKAEEAKGKEQGAKSFEKWDFLKPVA